MSPQNLDTETQSDLPEEYPEISAATPTEIDVEVDSDSEADPLDDLPGEVEMSFSTT